MATSPQMSLQQRVLFEDDLPPSESQRARADRASAQRALDELFDAARRYRTTQEYRTLLEFVSKFRFYSPFNAMLVHIQMSGARYVAPASRWLHQWGRRIKPSARPLVILQPMGPVMFVFDVSDTVPEKDAPPLPDPVERPFDVRGAPIAHSLELTIENAKRDGVRVAPGQGGAHWGGQIAPVQNAGVVEVTVQQRGTSVTKRIPVRYEIALNEDLDAEARYATLVHELAHLYCGHLGTPNAAWWPDRQGVSENTAEFEAESVAYLVCKRRGLENPSVRYLFGYLNEHKEVPPISLDRVMAAAGLIEAMGERRLGFRPARRGLSEAEQP